MRDPVSEQEIQAANLGARWTYENGELVLALPGPGMARTGAVAAYASQLADEMDHHPRIVLEYPGLRLSLHTHDAKAVTGVDLAYARRLEDWLVANGWPA